MRRSLRNKNKIYEIVWSHFLTLEHNFIQTTKQSNMSHRTCICRNIYTERVTHCVRESGVYA